MPGRVKPDFKQLDHKLWDEMVTFPASRTDDALTHLMEWFKEHLQVDNVLWLGILRMLDEEPAGNDPFCGWRIRARKSFLPDSEKYQKLIAQYFSNEHYGRLTPAFYRKGNSRQADVHVGMTSRALVQAAGVFRVYRMRDGWIDYKKFRKTEHYRLYYEDHGIVDRIWVVVPVSATAESIFLLDRLASEKGARRHFTQEESDFAGTVLRGLRDFHRRLLLRHGVLRNVKALSPLKLRLLQELLSGRSEKDIATTIGQRPTTMRGYVRELYTEFGVKSRPALMALWLGEA